jgi:hypothetical protein
MFSNAGLLALLFFLSASTGYSFVIKMTARGRRGLNALIHRHRTLWMEY